jgi:maltose O-acetyltransferase
MKRLLISLGHLLIFWDNILERMKIVRNTLHKYKIKANGALIGSNVTLHNSVYVRNPQNLRISDNTNVNHGSELYCAGGVNIGSGTMIAYSVMIFSDMRNYRGEMPLKKRKERSFLPVNIGDDVWVGARAIILPGVRVNDHAIIAAGAVVTRDVDAWSIVAGNPARVIGSRLEK